MNYYLSPFFITKQKGEAAQLTLDAKVVQQQKSSAVI